MLNDILLVVSKFNEDISWVKNVKHKTLIYDKSDNPVKNSIKRENFGREAETLLNYIISHYHNLPEITIFLQGDPRSNPPLNTIEECVEKINNLNKFDLHGFLTWDGIVDIENNWLKKVPSIHKKIFKNYKKDVKFSLGAQFVIPRQNILKNSLDFYIWLYNEMKKFNNKMLDSSIENFNDGIDAWSMEATWYEILTIDREINENYNK